MTYALTLLSLFWEFLKIGLFSVGGGMATLPFLNLAAVQVGDFALDRLDGVDLVHGLDMQADDQAGFHVQKIRHAYQGQFSISDRDANTPYIKKVRIVTTLFFLKKKKKNG